MEIVIIEEKELRVIEAKKIGGVIEEKTIIVEA